MLHRWRIDRHRLAVALASVRPEGYDHICAYIGECLPMARKFAENFKNEDGSPALMRERS